MEIFFQYLLICKIVNVKLDISQFYGVYFFFDECIKFNYDKLFFDVYI